MAIDQTPGVVDTPTRSETRDTWTQDFNLRVPAAKTGPGTWPYVEGSVVADALVPVNAAAITIGRGTNLSTSAGPWLLEIGEADGVEPRPAVGAIGFLDIVTSNGGSNIQAGTLVRSKVGQVRFQVSTTGLYFTNTPVPVSGIDTGYATNLPAGTPMEFPAPPPGCAQDAVVRAQSDGTGLTGGRPADDDQTYRQLISDARANPPASGNDAAYQQFIRKTPAISIQQVFTYPGIRGPGTIGYCFTLNPSRPGGSRSPNAAQIAATYANIVGQMPADDSVFACDLVNTNVRVCLRMTWSYGAQTWVDNIPWPPYVAGSPVKVTSPPTPTLTKIRLSTGTSTVAPQPGQTVGFYDPQSGTFKRIRIGSVTTISAGLIWDVFPDRSNNASDPTFVPIVNSVASPWGESLNLVAPAVIAYFDTLGPGEQVSPLPDPGLRQRRQPQSPEKWPSTIDERILVPVFKVSAVQSPIVLEPTIPTVTPVGVPAVSSNYFVLGDLGIFP